MQMGGERESVYRPTWWLVCGSAAGVVGFGVIAATGVASVLGERPAPHGGREVCGAFAEPLLALLLAVLNAWIIWEEAAKARRGLVSVTDAGVAVRDGRGREARLAWPDVRGLRAMSCLGLRTLHIHGGDRRLKVEFGVQGSDELRDLIIARAGLTDRTETWWGTVYRAVRGAG